MAIHVVGLVVRRILTCTGFQGRNPLLHIHLMGRFAVSVGDRDVAADAWGLRRAQDVVKALALTPGKRLQRDQLLDRFWPERDPDRAAHSLNQALYVARRAIASAGGDGHRTLRFTSETLMLCPDSALWVDADAFEQVACEAVGTGDAEQCRVALDLYTGELLPDDRYVDWVLPVRDRLARLHVDVMSVLARHLEVAGDLSGAADLLRRLLAETPLHEPTCRRLMRVYALAGDRSAAAEQFDRFGEVLRRALGLAPDGATTALAENIAAGRFAPAAWGPASPAGARLPTNLSMPVSSFIGRERELQELPALIASGRLVTLVGAGGCGKTRLAIEVAGRCLDAHAGGVFMVELAAVARPAEVALETARTLDVREGPDETVADAVARRIGHDHMLLVLDNCEHLASAAAALASVLLGACSRLVVLATSREPLRVPGEVVRRVAPLETPNPAHLPRAERLIMFDAVRLFTERVQALQPNFRVDSTTAADVADVCVRLDGMPLALELAATRVPALSLRGVAQHLDDRFRLLTRGSRAALSRQQTLEATVDWSYDLLEPREQKLFRRLSTFHGPFDLGAAQAVAESAIGRREVVPVLGELVERSMVVADGTEGHRRYRLLETMRAYGHAKLRQLDELSDARTDHARWVLELAAPNASDQSRVDRARQVSRLASMHDNLRPAMDHLSSTDPQSATRLAVLLWPYWLWRSHLGEGLSLLEGVLAHAADPSRERFEALVGAVALSVRWRFEASERHVYSALADARALDDGRAICRALLLAVGAPWCRGETAAAAEHMADARKIAREGGDVGAEVAAILMLATAAAAGQDLDDARDLLAEADALVPGVSEDDPVLCLFTLGAWMPTRRRGVLRLMWNETWVVFEDLVGAPLRARIHAARANLERMAGRIDDAQVWLDRSMALYRSTGDASGEALIWCRRGQMAFTAGDLHTATTHLEASLRLREDIGHVRGAEVSLISLARVAAERGNTDAAHGYLDRVEALSRRHLDRVAYGMTMIERGILALDDGRPTDAVARLQEALEIDRALGDPTQLACVLRDLGCAQVAAGMTKDAIASLSEAQALFVRGGYQREAARCQRAVRTVGSHLDDQADD